LKADAVPQMPATVHAALTYYGKIFNLVIALAPNPAPSAIPLISSKYLLLVYLFVTNTFKSRIEFNPKGTFFVKNLAMTGGKLFC
jgi:hypothetical protein